MFDENKRTILCEIMGRHRSDKGHVNITTSWHNYTILYYDLFKALRNKNLRIFELGLGTNNVNIPSNMGPNGRPGASLYGWNEFFPNSYIFGADIDTEILFEADRISTFYCDQTNPTSIIKLWDQPQLQNNLDIIIDDGLHTFSANVCFLENSIHKLNPGGYYIIEDIVDTEYNLFAEKIIVWKRIYTNHSFDLRKLPSERNKVDNTLLIIYRQI
jgi:hypothetical protein